MKNKISFIFPIIISIIYELIFVLCNSSIYIKFHLGSFLFNLIIIYLVWFIIYGFTRKTKFSNIFIVSFYSFFLFANTLKIYFAQDAISLLDFLLVFQTGDIVNTVKKDILSGVLYSIPILVVSIAIIIGVVKLSKKFNYKSTFKYNFIFSIISIILFISLFITNEPKNNFLIKVFFHDNNIENTSSLLDNYGCYRMFSGMYYNYIINLDYTEKIDKDEYNKIISDYQEEKNNTDFGKPNIIVMFTESFWDITEKQNTFKFSNDPLSEYHELRNKSIVIDTLSPTFGGKSANSEFEFLTGSTLSYYSLDTIAYQKFYKSNNANNFPSILKELKNNGYNTNIISAHCSSVYNCKDVYDTMDVDYYYSPYDDYGYNISDEKLIDLVIDKFNSKNKDEKIFIMSASMESHMPYTKDKYDKYDFEVTSELSSEYNDIIKVYTQSIKNASLQLIRMYNYIQSLEEDTIIVYYGDHLPLLKSSNIDLYDFIDTVNTDNKLSNYYNKYNTETLILSNYDIKDDDIKQASFDMIFTTIINNMDINISDYYKWLYSTRKVLPSINAKVSKDLNGILYSPSKLNDEQEDVLEKRKKVQNYLFN